MSCLVSQIRLVRASAAIQAIAFLAAAGFAGAAPTDPAALIRANLDAPAASVEGVALDRDTLARAYLSRDYQPVWAAHPGMDASLPDVLVARAELDGIDPKALGVDVLRAQLAGPALPPEQRELLLSDRYLALARILVQGSVAPSDIEEDWILARPEFDPAAALASLAQNGDPAAALAALAPASSDYERLRTALERYRALAVADWPTLSIEEKLEPGMAGPGVRALRARLAAEGELLQGVSDLSDSFDAELSAAVRLFQAQHGLTVDGKAGRTTLAAMNVSAADRVRQIELGLERWRAMPHEWPASRIEVNVAAATLTLYRDDAPVLTSRVIVGDPKHPTPVLAARAEAVLFNPPWNVPASIIRKEIRPKLRRDPNYLADNHFSWLEPGRLQQEPGPWNSLGRIKIELPNPLDVYLHDTPARSFFAKAARALSHGCVRVEQVRGLAAALLGDAWPGEAIDAAIAGGNTQRVALAKAVPVFLIYTTAFVDGDGAVEFRDDIYGRDRRLAAALAHAVLANLSDPEALPVGEEASGDANRD